MAWFIAILFGGLILAKAVGTCISDARVQHVLQMCAVSLAIAVPLLRDWLRMQRELFIQREADARPRLTLAQTLLVLFAASLELGGAVNIYQTPRPVFGVLLMVLTPIALYLALETMEVRGPFSIYRRKIEPPQGDGLFWSDEPIQPREDQAAPVEATHGRD